MSVVQSYIDLIRSQRDISQPLYLLVDPLEVADEDDCFSLESLENTLGKGSIAVVERPDLSHTLADCPHLVLLAQAGEPLDGKLGDVFDATIEYAHNEHPAERRYICGWLQSGLGLHALAAEIARRTVYAAAQGDMIAIANADADDALPAGARIYPVYEPLRQELIAYACNEAAPHIHAQWLGAISQWIVPASNRGFLCFKAEPVSPADSANAANTADGPVMLPQSAINAQIDTALAADVLRTWVYLCTQPLGPEQRQQMPLLARSQYTLPQGAVYMALQQLHAAHSRGLADAKDRQVFAIMRLTMHPRMEQHPVVRERIDHAVRSPSSLAAQMRQLSHVQIMRILQELDA
ncbi:hypothetical protein CUZ56_01765 [Saezia sanguinis]|uniref:DUF4123 domain-containing protein n=1 Tax=Saezia sanguinis TaxID=1965230 RepID=A0A433SCL8_9BURK|nr:hypothetical protein CUZ56_01765 [Saezia sanguinis]